MHEMNDVGKIENREYRIVNHGKGINKKAD